MKILENFWPVEHHLHVVPDVRVPVLIDCKAGRGVEKLDVHYSNLQKNIKVNKESFGLALRGIPINGGKACGLATH